jgi:ABC-type sugar transport system ATPase subunit
LTATDQRLDVTGDALHLTVPARHLSAYGAAAGRPVLLGIRPEDIYESQANPEWQPIDVTVVAIEALGVENIIIGQIGREHPIEISARLSRHFLAEVGATVRLYIDALPMHLFDPESGKVFARPPLAIVPPLTLAG